MLIGRFILLLLVLGVWAAPWRAAVAQDQPVELVSRTLEDPAVSSGTIAGGVRTIIRRHTFPPGQAVVRLVVEAGSMHEDADRPGAAFTAAHLLHHTGVARRTGAAILSLGEALGPGTRGLDVRVDHHATSFTVALPLADEKALAVALKHLGSIARGEGLSPAHLDAHRTDVLRDREGRQSLPERLSRLVLQDLIPDSPLSTQPPVPSEEALCALTAEDLRRFHGRWFTPERMTVVVVGEVSPETAADAVAREFAGMPRLKGPKAPVLRAPIMVGRATSVARDAELTHGVAELLALGAKPEAVRTEADLLKELTVQLSLRLLQRRLIAAGDEPGAATRGSAVWSGPAAGGIRVSLATTKGEPGQWAQYLAELSGQVERTRRDTPDPHELDEARRAYLKELADAAREETLTPGVKLIDRSLAPIVCDEPWLSAGQRSMLAQKLLREVSPEAVRRAIDGVFDPSQSAYVVLLPESVAAPSEEEILSAAAKGAAAARVASSAEPLPESILDAAPAPGRVMELTADPSTSVTSAWLSSGVRLHHRLMRSQPGVAGAGRVVLCVTLAGGRTDETPGEIGLTDAAAALFESPATRTRTASQLRGLLARQGVELRGWVRPDSLTLEITAPLDGAETAFQLAHALLSEPAVEPPAVERWKRNLHDRTVAARSQATTLAAELFLSSLEQSVMRSDLALASLDLNALRAPRIEQWARALVRRAPIEASVVGDLPRGESLRLAARYLGSIESRERINAQDCAAPIVPARAAGFAGRRLEDRAGADQSVVMVAASGAAAREPAARFALDVASRILSARLATLREGPGRLASAVAVQHLVAEGPSETPLLYAFASGDGPSAEAMLAKLEEAFAGLAAADPTEAEMLIARTQALEELDRRLADPISWARTLSSLTLTGRRLEQLSEARSVVQGLTAPEVRRRFVQSDPASCCGAPRLVVIVKPEAITR